MPEPEQTQWSRDNRDLLIELKTQVAALRTDVRELRDNTSTRLATVEMGKLDRTEANRLLADQLTTNNDHETRLRFIERYMWLAIGALTVAQFALNYFQPFKE